MVIVRSCSNPIKDKISSPDESPVWRFSVAYAKSQCKEIFCMKFTQQEIDGDNKRSPFPFQSVRQSEKCSCLHRHSWFLVSGWLDDIFCSQTEGIQFPFKDECPTNLQFQGTMLPLEYVSRVSTISFRVCEHEVLRDCSRQISKNEIRRIWIRIASNFPSRMSV